MGVFAIHGYSFHTWMVAFYPWMAESTNGKEGWAYHVTSNDLIPLLRMKSIIVEFSHH